MSLRKIAKERGISPAYLSYMVSGKRPWRADLYQRYCYFVNTSVNTQHENGEMYTGNAGTMVGGTGLEPVTSAMSTRRSSQLS